MTTINNSLTSINSTTNEMPIKMCRRIMETYDKERKGTLAETEIANILIDIYRYYSKTITPTKSDIEGFIRQLDYDKDNTVSRYDIEDSIKKYMKADDFDVKGNTERTDRNSLNQSKNYDTRNSEKMDKIHMRIAENFGKSQIHLADFSEEFMEDCDEGASMTYEPFQRFIDQYYDRLGVTTSDSGKIFEIADEFKTGKVNYIQVTAAIKGINKNTLE